jgi:Cu/Ag efflux pump CusA
VYNDEGYNLSVAVWVGLIALAGLDAETGVVMLLYLDLAYEQWIREGKMLSLGDLRDAIYYGAVKRVRPKAMTAAVIIAGLVPILWSHGAGADVMKRIATPMIGGIVTSTVMELAVYPAIYFIWRSHQLKRRSAVSQADLTKIRSEGENQSQVQFLYERLPAPKSEGRALITTGDGESQFAAISQTQT